MAIESASELAKSHRIAAAMKEDILAGKYPPGVKIRPEDIAKEFGASRSPVREALRMLEAYGLVNLVANTGAWIAKLSLAQCEEMYLVREHIDPLLLRLSIPLLTPECIIELENLTSKMENNSDAEVFLKLDREFHLLSYSGADTILLGPLVYRLWDITQHYRRVYTKLLAGNAFIHAHYEHYLLLLAIKNRDTEAAESILNGHIRRTRLELSNHPDIFLDNN